MPPKKWMLRRCSPKSGCEPAKAYLDVDKNAAIKRCEEGATEDDTTCSLAPKPKPQDGGRSRTANPWIAHVKDYSRRNGLTYTEALKDPHCRTEYYQRGS